MKKKQPKIEHSITIEKKEELTNAVAGTFTKNAAIEWWFTIASLCDACDRKQNANGHENHHRCH